VIARSNKAQVALSWIGLGIDAFGLIWVPEFLL
jgi:hypothetical protein